MTYWVKAAALLRTTLQLRASREAAVSEKTMNSINTSTRNHRTLIQPQSQNDYSSPTQWGRLGGGRGTNARHPVCGEAPTLILPHCVEEETE